MTPLWPTTLVLLLAHAAGAAPAGSVKGTVTGSGGTAVANAVVMLEGAGLPAPRPAGRAVIDQRDQTFVPHVLAVAVGTTVDFPNHDPMLHNVFSASPAKKFDLGMYNQGETRSVTFDTPGVVRIGCNVHPKMEAFVVVHANAFVAVTDAQGAYTLTGVPPGSYQVRVWHEHLAERRVPVIVREGQVQPLDVRLDARR
jgi:plastocyanin